MRRRGGNCPNTIEVLQQLLRQHQNALRLSLLSVLPDEYCPAVQEIRRSLGDGVSTATCLYRSEHSEPASSYIVRNLQNGSRTIINYNALPEMTYPEFIEIANDLGRDATWYHFEVGTLVTHIS